MKYLEGATYLIVIQLAIFAMLNIKESKQSHKLLGALMLLVAISIKDFWTYYFDEVFIHYLINNSRFDYFYGPLLFLFIKSIILPIPRKEIALHLILPFLFFLYTMTGSFLIYFDIIQDPNIGITEMRVFLFLTYSVLIIRLLKNEQWNLNKYAIRYRYIFLIFGIYLINHYVDVMMYKYFHELRNSLLPGLIIYDAALYIGLVCFLTYFTATEINGLKKYFLTSQRLAHIKGIEEIEVRLKEVIQVEKIHTQDDLNLTTLSKAVGIGKDELSQYIQSRYNTTFYDLVNTWRINEFKNKVFDQKYAHMDILGIAYESGFKSKATFNRAFKKLEGITPSEYRKRQLYKAPAD